MLCPFTIQQKYLSYKNHVLVQTYSILNKLNYFIFIFKLFWKNILKNGRLNILENNVHLKIFEPGVELS